MARRPNPSFPEASGNQKRKPTRAGLAADKVAVATTAKRSGIRAKSFDDDLHDENNDAVVLPRFQIVFGQNVKDLRKAANLKQFEVAKRAGLTQQRMSQIERGHQNVTLRTMIKLAEVLDQDVRDFLIGLRPAPKKR